MSPEYRMHDWHSFFFSDSSLITAYSGEFPTDDPDIILMQFTGRQDMNGVDIYEDDIIYREILSPDDPGCGSYGDVGVVKEDPHAMGWFIDAVDNNYLFYDQLRMNFSFDDIKVIGNIHENWDLLGR